MMYRIKKVSTSTSSSNPDQKKVQGSILPLSHIRQSCMLFPVFPSSVPAHWKADKVLDTASSFYINNWLSKYCYQTIWQVISRKLLMIQYVLLFFDDPELRNFSSSSQKTQLHVVTPLQLSQHKLSMLGGTSLALAPNMDIPDGIVCVGSGPMEMSTEMVHIVISEWGVYLMVVKVKIPIQKLTGNYERNSRKLMKDMTVRSSRIPSLNLGRGVINPERAVFQR